MVVAGSVACKVLVFLSVRACEVPLFLEVCDVFFTLRSLGQGLGPSVGVGVLNTSTPLFKFRNLVNSLF